MECKVSLSQSIYGKTICRIVLELTVKNQTSEIDVHKLYKEGCEKYRFVRYVIIEWKWTMTN